MAAIRILASPTRATPATTPEGREKTQKFPWNQFLIRASTPLSP